MCEHGVGRVECPAESPQDALTEILRRGAQGMLAQAIKAEMVAWVAAHEHLTDDDGHRCVVRNGYLPERTTNPIESTFATVRLRTRRTKGCGSRVGCLTMVFKLVPSAERHWRALNGSALIPEGLEGVHFIDGMRKEAA